MSYARFDDEHENGYLTKFRMRLSREIRLLTGNTFTIFQDRYDIAWGQNWESRINEALDVVTFLIPIMTPSFFKSTGCLGEVERFFDRERRLGRDDLILPLYYVSAEELENPDRSNEFADALLSHQFADWRELRGMSITSLRVRREITALAQRIADSLRSDQVDKSEPRSELLQRRPSTDTATNSTASSRKSQAPQRRRLVGEVTHPRTATAKILHLRPSGSDPTDASQAALSRDDEAAAIWWTLAAQLRQTTFQPMDRTILAARTKEIRATLAQELPPHPTHPSEVSEVIGGLVRILESAVAPTATVADIQSSCELAERLRKLLIGLIAT